MAQGSLPMSDESSSRITHRGQTCFFRLTPWSSHSSWPRLSSHDCLRFRPLAANLRAVDHLRRAAWSPGSCNFSAWSISYLRVRFALACGSLRGSSCRGRRRANASARPTYAPRHLEETSPYAIAPAPVRYTETSIRLSTRDRPPPRRARPLARRPEAARELWGSRGGGLCGEAPLASAPRLCRESELDDRYADGRVPRPEQSGACAVLGRGGQLRGSRASLLAF
jgi:hypothetical protein